MRAGLVPFACRVWVLLQEDYPYLRRVELHVVEGERLRAAGFSASPCFLPSGAPVRDWGLPGTPPLVYLVEEEGVWESLLLSASPRWQTQPPLRWVARQPLWLRVAFGVAHEAGHALLLGDTHMRDVARRRAAERDWAWRAANLFAWPQEKAYALMPMEHEADAFAGGWVRRHKARIWRQIAAV